MKNKQAITIASTLLIILFFWSGCEAVKKEKPEPLDIYNDKIYFGTNNYHPNWDTSDTIFKWGSRLYTFHDYCDSSLRESHPSSFYITHKYLYDSFGRLKPTNN